MNHWTAPILLDEQRESDNNPAYLCGRLAGVLEDLEFEATNDHTVWYQLMPQAVANGSVVLQWVGRTPAWLNRVDPERSAQYRTEITRLKERIGTPGVLAGGENGWRVSLGYHHQQAAMERDNRYTVVLADPDMARWIADMPDLAGNRYHVDVDGNTITVSGAALSALSGLDFNCDGFYDGTALWVGGDRYEVTPARR